MKRNVLWGLSPVILGVWARVYDDNQSTLILTINMS